MSSILKALKKLENDTSVKGDIRSSRHQPHAKASKMRAPSDAPSKKRMIIIFSTLFLLVASGLTLIFKPWEKQPASTITTDIDADNASLSSSAIKTPAITPKKTPPKKDSAKYEPLNGAVKDLTMDARKVEKEAPELFEKPATNEAKTSDGFGKKSASIQPINSSQLIGENEQTSYQMEDEAQSVTIPIKSFSESMLELQAIAWSQHPKKRMVVINGHIVHEGDVVEKATVKHIGKNEVVFLKGGKEWRQLFRSAGRF